MTWSIAEFLVGLALALLTLRDVVDTVITPGRTGGAFKVVRRVVFLSLPVWRRARSREEGLSTSFGPFVLVTSFVIWMLLLTLGFGLMAHALAGSFDPVLPSLPQALYVAASGLVTVGLSETDATGMARWVVAGAGFCGLAVMTLAVTYLLEVQGSIAERDAGILKMTTAAGQPPSGLALLERYAELGCRDDIPGLLQEGREWCARVRQSHASHPSLIYFRSPGTASGWPATLGALMDLALTCELLLDEPRWRGPGVMLREEGGRMAETLADIVGLEHSPETPSAEELEQMMGRLADAGYAVKAEMDLSEFAQERGRHCGCVRAMSEHLGTLEAPLIPMTPAS